AVILRRIILFSLTHRFLILAAAAAAALGGAFALGRMPADVLPPLNAPVVLVVVENAGLAPQEMEALVARPLESAVRGLPGTRFVRTKSSQGLTILTVQFPWGADFYRILQQVAGAVAQGVERRAARAKDPGGLIMYAYLELCELIGDRDKDTPKCSVQYHSVCS